MYKSLLTVVLAVSVAAIALPGAIGKRDPSDKSGTSTMAYACDDTTLPNPGGDEGTGEGGDGIFSVNMQFKDANNQTHSPTGCTAIDNFCTNCLIEGGGLSSPTNVTGCSNPAAGACSIEFLYNGYDYNSETKEPKCGHENSGVKAFSDTKTAICYFDV